MKKWEEFSIDEKHDLLIDWFLCTVKDLSEEDIEACRNLINLKQEKVYKLLLVDFALLGYGPEIIINAIKEERIDELLSLLDNFDFRKFANVEKEFIEILVNNYNYPQFQISSSYNEVVNTRK